METDRRTLLLFFLVLTLGGGLLYVGLNPTVISGAIAGQTSTAEADTPYGESLSIELTSESSTSGAASWFNSWTASYDDSDSQNVYTVNSTYKSTSRSRPRSRPLTKAHQPIITSTHWPTPRA